MLATLYKARGVATKSEVCAICVERSRGRTVRVHLGRGVSVWLCAGHASDEFRCQRGGRDFVLTLHRLWSAHGCLTKPRSRALDDHLAAMRSEARAPRHRPGSYSWATLRREAEQRFRAGEEPAGVIRELRARHAGDTARAPSLRTMRRWYQERRWLRQTPVAVVSGPGMPIGRLRVGQLADTSPPTNPAPSPQSPTTHHPEATRQAPNDPGTPSSASHSRHDGEPPEARPPPKR